MEIDLEEELQFHLEHRIEEGIARGLSPQEARLQAMRGMDGLEQRKEEIRDARRVRFMTDFLDDLRFAVRRAAQEGAIGAKTGAVTAEQRASSDMRLNPHLHTIALDGAWSRQGNDLVARGQAARFSLAPVAKGG